MEPKGEEVLHEGGVSGMAPASSIDGGSKTDTRDHAEGHEGNRPPMLTSRQARARLALDVAMAPHSERGTSPHARG